MKTRKLVYDGKTKVLYEGPEPETLVLYFKDEAASGDGRKKAVLEGKGVLNNRISEYLMSRLTEIGVPNHFMRRLNMREQLIREVEIIPLQVVVRNVAAGSLAKRFDMEEGTVLPRSIIEFYLKNDKLQNPMITEEHITAFNWASPHEIDEVVAMAIRINDFLSGLFLGAGIKLVDMRIEFGRLWENDMMRVILADEVSPDSMRLWDLRTGEKLDRDRAGGDPGRVTEAYSEVAKRLGILTELQNTERKGPVLVK
jgi:phosphoribosylaminoimidazole-succinocarboxamide synthase